MEKRNFASIASEVLGGPMRAVALDTLQVNVGFLCNQCCAHCHLAAGPNRAEAMGEHTADCVLEALAQLDSPTLDVTGGAPELNPQLPRLVEGASEAGCEVMVRTNLTALAAREDLQELFRACGVHLVASMPCYLEENVEAQRGAGVYEECIEMLQRLNGLGYGRRGRLALDLVYNPGGAFLPPDQPGLEADYREHLGATWGIQFDHLMVIANMPLGRFAETLRGQRRFERYGRLLRESFNPATVDAVMCRRQVNVGPDGTLYDCDFNLAARMPVTVEGCQSIGEFDPDRLLGRRIATAPHCFGCTAGAGSSCRGALAQA